MKEDLLVPRIVVLSNQENVITGFGLCVGYSY